MIRPDDALSRLGGASPEGDALLILAYVAELEAAHGRAARSLQSLQDGATIALAMLPSEGVVPDFLAAIHREAGRGLAADPLGQDPRQGRLPLVSGDVVGPYRPPPPLVRTDCLDAMGGRVATPRNDTTEFTPHVHLSDSQVGNLNETCAVCGSEPGELCRRSGLVCEFGDLGQL